MRKIDRSAFLYLEPTYVNREQFAQCGTCAFWNRGNSLCMVMDIGVDADDTCGLYAEGAEINMMPRSLATPDELGFEEREVRCENCLYANEGRCHLYLQLNSMFPEAFDLDARISPYGCCNANTPKEK